jgi:hypothetical protein
LCEVLSRWLLLLHHREPAGGCSITALTICHYPPPICISTKGSSNLENPKIKGTPWAPLRLRKFRKYVWGAGSGRDRDKETEIERDREIERFWHQITLLLVLRAS